MTRVLIILLMMSLQALAVQILDLDSALSKALETNPMILAAKSNYEAEASIMRSQQWLSDPIFGVMYEKNMSLMQQQMGPMTTLTFGQDIQFPTKYYYRGQIQRSRAQYAKESLEQSKLSLRRQVINVYYSFYVNQQIKTLLEAQQDALREVARIAESRHVTGAVSQQDEMKAHVEQSLVETEYLSITQEEIALRAKLVSLLGNDLGNDFSTSVHLDVPKADLPETIPEILYGHSRQIKQNQIVLQETHQQKQLTLLSYAPDFRLGAKTMVGANRPNDNFGISLELSLPLWFFMRQTSEVAAASARTRHAARSLESTKRILLANAKELSSKIQTYAKLIQIYSTTLIPQAESTFASSRAGYRAGRIGFLELLDSERSVYAVRMSYYRHIEEYVSNLVELEELVGTSMSSLPFGELS